MGCSNRSTITHPGRRFFLGLSLSYSPNCKTLASSGDNTIKIWQIAQKVTPTTQPILHNRIPATNNLRNKILLWFLGIYFLLLAIIRIVQFFTNLFSANNSREEFIRSELREIANSEIMNPNFDKEYLKRCLAHFKLEDYRNAVDDCSEAVKINPNNDEAYSLRGASYYLNGNKYQGMQDLQKAANMGNQKAREILKKLNK